MATDEQRKAEKLRKANQAALFAVGLGPEIRKSLNTPELKDSVAPTVESLLRKTPESIPGSTHPDFIQVATKVAELTARFDALMIIIKDLKSQMAKLEETVRGLSSKVDK